MKILKSDGFISERAKVKPITNAEWETVKFTIPVEIPLSNVKSVNDLENGWLVVIKSLRLDLSNEHNIRVVVPYEYAKSMFANSKIKDEMYFVAVVNDEYFPTGHPTYFNAKMFDDSFPYSKPKWFVIEKIYKFHIPNLKSICYSKKSFQEWYRKQNFDNLIK